MIFCDLSVSKLGSSSTGDAIPSCPHPITCVTRTVTMIIIGWCRESSFPCRRVQLFVVEALGRSTRDLLNIYFPGFSIKSFQPSPSLASISEVNTVSITQCFSLAILVLPGGPHRLPNIFDRGQGKRHWRRKLWWIRDTLTEVS